MELRARPCRGRASRRGHYHEHFVYAAYRTGPVPARFFFANEAPDDPAPLFDALGTENIVFDAPATGFAVDASLMDFPMPAADASLFPMLEHYLGFLQSSQPPPSADLVDQVRHRVRTALSEGPPDLESVAKSLHMAGRTLQRRLNEAGRSFNQVVDDLRRDLALDHVAKPTA